MSWGQRECRKSKTTTLLAQHTLECSRSHEHDMKLLNFTPYGEHKKREQMSSPILNLDTFHKNLTPGELSCIWQIERVVTIALKFQWTRSPFFSELFAPVAVVWRGILNSLLSSIIPAFSGPNSVNQRPFIAQSSILKGTLYSWTRLVKSFVLFVFRVSNLAFILRSFQLKTTASANLKVILKTDCMSHVHTKRLPTATPSISRAFLRYTYYGGSYYVVKLSYSILF